MLILFFKISLRNTVSYPFALLSCILSSSSSYSFSLPSLSLSQRKTTVIGKMMWIAFKGTQLIDALPLALTKLPLLSPVYQLYVFPLLVAGCFVVVVVVVVCLFVCFCLFLFFVWLVGFLFVFILFLFVCCCQFCCASFSFSPSSSTSYFPSPPPPSLLPTFRFSPTTHGTSQSFLDFTI